MAILLRLLESPGVVNSNDICYSIQGIELWTIVTMADLAHLHDLVQGAIWRERVFRD